MTSSSRNRVEKFASRRQQKHHNWFIQWIANIGDRTKHRKIIEYWLGKWKYGNIHEKFVFCMFWLKSSNERSKFWSRSRVSLFDKLEIKKYSIPLSHSARSVPCIFQCCSRQFCAYCCARSTADADQCWKISPKTVSCELREREQASNTIASDTSGFFSS